MLIIRIKALQDKLVQRIRPFVEAKNPGDVNDTETKVFEQRIKTEAEDMKLESFGIEVSGGCIAAYGVFLSFMRHSRRLSAQQYHGQDGRGGIDSLR